MLLINSGLRAIKLIGFGTVVEVGDLRRLLGTVLLVWSLPVVILDNFLRPALIRKGADLPLLLIFAGVIGGLVAFGIIGLFIGPVVLAVAFTLLKAWVSPAAEKHEPIIIGKK